MTNSIKLVRTLAATLITLGSLAGGANGAIILGTENSSTDWDVGGISITTGSFGSQHLEITPSVNTPLSAGSNVFRRSTDLTTNSFIVDLAFSNLRFNLMLENGATESDDNWVLLDIDKNGTNDTVVQIALLNSNGTPDILKVLHDNAGLNADILRGVTSFSQITVSSVPEPSSTLFLGLGALVFVFRRRRIN